MSLFSELKDRKVIRVAAAYLLVAWVVVQVVDAVSEPLLLPVWFARGMILLLALGFPFSLILSWVLDATPAKASGKGKPLALGLIAATAVVVGVILYGFNSDDSEPEMAAGQSVEVATPDIEVAEGVLPNSVAVLPFDNLSPDPDDAYFAAGLHDEILNQLTKLRNLSVISRTSVLRYSDSGLSAPEIARELNVGTIMEGTVRYANDRVRITTQLIDAATDEHLWSETYEREFSDIFAIESDIATNIADEHRERARS